jgi:hypothetical protein
MEIQFANFPMFLLLDLLEKCHNVGQFIRAWIRFVIVLKRDFYTYFRCEVHLILSVIYCFFKIKLECVGHKCFP